MPEKSRRKAEWPNQVICMALSPVVALEAASIGRAPARSTAGLCFARAGRATVIGARGLLVPPSWPGLSRPSTSLMMLDFEDVDARDKRAHDESIRPHPAEASRMPAPI